MNKIFLGVALCCVLAVQSCIREKDNEKNDDVEYVTVGDLVPSFTVYDNDGRKSFGPADFTGKISLIVLYSSTCSDCELQMPVIDEIWNELAGANGYQVLAIAREGGADLSKAYCYNDRSRAAYNKFATKWVPRLYVAGVDGRITWMYKDVADRETILAALGYHQGS